MYNGEFNQCIEITVKSDDHDVCLRYFNVIKKQCEAWFFNVKYNEFKSARKGPVLSRTIMIYQIAYAPDILIFKESMRIICKHVDGQYCEVKFSDRGVEPINDLRQRH
jgi:hypothetical protein